MERGHFAYWFLTSSVTVRGDQDLAELRREAVATADGQVICLG